MTLENYLKTNKKKILIFDFDLTIVKLNFEWPHYVMLYRRLLDKVNHLLPRNQSTTLSNTFSKLFWGRGSMAWRWISKSYFNFERKHLKDYEVNADLVKFIKDNQGKYNFAIWSSNSSITVDFVLGQLGLTEIFQIYITQDKVRFIKPYTEGFTPIYDKFKGDKSGYLMIGDNPDTDGIAADKCGIDYHEITHFTKPNDPITNILTKS